MYSGEFSIWKRRTVGVRDRLFYKGIIDSTGVIELVSFLEETFEISIDDEELIPENLSSLKNISVFLQQKTEPKVA